MPYRSAFGQRPGRKTLVTIEDGFGPASPVLQTSPCSGFLDYPESITWTELIAFWVMSALIFVGFIGWFNLDERLEKPSNTPSVIHHGSGTEKK